MRKGSGLITIKQPYGALRDQKGAILLEFAFVITILMVIFLATITFSFLLSDFYGVQKVAREGAREASITGSTQWAGEKVLQAAWLWGLDDGRVTIDFSRDGTAVTCYVTYASTPFHKNFMTIFGSQPLSDVTMRARASFVWLESH